MINARIERKGNSFFVCIAFLLCDVMRMGLEFPFNRRENGGSGEMTCHIAVMVQRLASKPPPSGSETPLIQYPLFMEGEGPGCHRVGGICAFSPVG